MLDQSNTQQTFTYSNSTINLLALIWVWGGVKFYLPGWFSLNNSKTVKAVTLELCIIHQHCIRDIRAKFAIHNSLQTGVFLISGFLVNPL